MATSKNMLILVWRNSAQRMLRLLWPFKTVARHCIWIKLPLSQSVELAQWPKSCALP